jgi:putative copper export protein
VARFGRVAALAVTTLAATGAALTAAHLATAGQLVTTIWGGLLIAKLVGVAIALVLAQSRRWRGELSVQTLILALAALLATVPPPR